ncbi:amino acid/polyamine transporter I [Penicillium diatomitis]|uniref:Amino acid/polyamine transporter I n=1 Tax=Penicillium diatomitis TaxID=2819901 RepID=A0A9X0BY36_9EURO|nr:amino acid/polyamine transporter I [Penicillium diatomitis]KAJ5488802.1 amino acid/polyamine transporter I [Penicillium diatomitis]
MDDAFWAGEKENDIFEGLISLAELSTVGLVQPFFPCRPLLPRAREALAPALIFWLIGFIQSFCGFCIWLELGSVLPRSGGEKACLEAAYLRPPLLATTIFAVHVVVPGFTGIGSIMAAENILLAVHGTANDWIKRSIVVALVVGVASLHIFGKNLSIRIMVDVPHPGGSFAHPFAGSSTTYVMDEIKDPKRTLKWAGILEAGSVGLLYLLVNVAYFTVATPQELSETGVTVVALLVGRAFGPRMQWLAAFLAALSSLGNLMTASFPILRVIQGLTTEGVVPFPSFFASRTSSGRPAASTFLLVFLPSVLMVTLMPLCYVSTHRHDDLSHLLIRATEDTYNSLLDVGQYAMAIILFFVVAGFFIIRNRVAYPPRTFKVWSSVAHIYLAVQSFLVILPLAGSGKSDTHLPSWLTPVGGLLTVGFSCVYWSYLWYILPKIGNIIWQKRISTCSDGAAAVVCERRYLS